MYRALVLPALLLLAAAIFPQQPSSNTPAQKTPSYEGIPVSAAKQANPVPASAESLARAKKWWTMADFTNPDTLKERTVRRDFLHHQERAQ